MLPDPNVVCPGSRYVNKKASAFSSMRKSHVLYRRPISSSSNESESYISDMDGFRRHRSEEYDFSKAVDVTTKSRRKSSSSGYGLTWKK